ncbi:MAG: hypothetical protein ACT4QB_17730 [Gammaproteobacteria bacterium]
MCRSFARPGAAALLAAAMLVLSPATSAQAPPAPGAVLASQDTNVAGVVGEIVECKRKEGVLTIKLRFRNTGAEAASFYMIDGQNYDAQYVTAGSKKYFVLRDSEKVPLAPQPNGGGNIRVSLAPDATWTWWAKYPAPPAEVKSVSYFTSVAPPFEDIPITDL